MSEVPIMLLEVEFEEVEGVRRIKKNEKGEHPIEAYGHTLIEMDREHQKNNNGWPLIDISVCKVKGDQHGDPEHYEATIYSMETGTSEPVQKVIIIDKATGKPAAIVSKDGKYTPKAESAFHLGQMLTHEKLKEAALKRGLQIKSEQLKQFSKLTEALEG